MQFNSVEINPPPAACYGGWLENLIRQVNDLLKRVLVLNYEVMITPLADCEIIKNSRSLTYISEIESDK